MVSLLDRSLVKGYGTYGAIMDTLAGYTEAMEVCVILKLELPGS